jgi:hypothetical protein
MARGRNSPAIRAHLRIKSQPDDHVRVISIVEMAGCPFEGRNES